MMPNKLNLTVDIDRNSGFCFGVKQAIQLAEEALEKGREVYCLGQIVHNDLEIERLLHKGLHFISHEELSDIHDTTVLIRAHGEPPSTYELARSNNNTILDATCPIILNIHNKIAQSNDHNRVIYIFGKKNHPEVIGLAARAKNEVIVFDSIHELDVHHIPQEIALYSQTTRDLNEFYKAVHYLRNQGINVEVHDTICRHVSNRKEEIGAFCSNHDIMLFVAGQKSSNGKMLYDVCSAVNKNTFFVSDPGEVQRNWFRAHQNVGIAGATSTPHWLMEKIKRMLEDF